MRQAPKPILHAEDRTPVQQHVFGCAVGLQPHVAGSAARISIRKLSQIVDA